MKVLKAIFKRRGSVVWFSVTIAVVALLLVATILATGPFRSIISTVLGGPGPIMREGVEQIYTSDYDSKQQSKEAGDELNVQIASEGFILLMNDGNGLPIRTPESETDTASERPKISVFGKNSVNLVYGGSGSGGSGEGPAVGGAPSSSASGSSSSFGSSAVMSLCRSKEPVVNRAIPTARMIAASSTAKMRYALLFIMRSPPKRMITKMI